MWTSHPWAISDIYVFQNGHHNNLFLPCFGFALYISIRLGPISFYFSVDELNKIIIPQSDQMLCVIHHRIKIQYGRHTFFLKFLGKIYNILLSCETRYSLKYLI